MTYKRASKPTLCDTYLSYQEGFFVTESYLKKGVIDKAGNVIIPFVYDEMEDCSEGLFCACYRDKYGFLNAKNEWIIEPIYDSADSFNEGLAAVSIDYKYGFINKENEVIIPLIYNYASDYSEGLFFVENDDSQQYFIDREGNLLFKNSYKHKSEFINGVSIVQNDEDLIGVTDKRNNIVIPCIYKDILAYKSSKYFLATLPDGTQFLFDWSGTKLEGLFSEYDSIDQIYPQYLSVVKNGLYGLVNQDGALAIPCIYSERLTVGVDDTLAITSKNGLYGAVSIDTGETVIPFQYVELTSCGEGCYALSPYSRELIVVSQTNEELFRLNIDKSIMENYDFTMITNRNIDGTFLPETENKDLIDFEVLKIEQLKPIANVNFLRQNILDFNQELMDRYGIDPEQDLN